jgi:hypothetical protein
VGAGPGGLAAARYLLAHGFEPVLFEQSSRLGGQWNAGTPHSGIWPSMRTNTSRVTTHFSDLPWPPGTNMFPANAEVLAYFERYSDSFGITARIRLEHHVEQIKRDGSGNWQITYRARGGAPRTEVFAKVIIASGRYSLPKIPEVPGLESFSGPLGVSHTFQYRGPDRFRGKRVLVAGCSISAVEIAPEMAMGGAARVVSCFRRQRYVLHRIVAGIPIDFLTYTRAGVLAEERLPRAQVLQSLKDFVMRTGGAPEHWGALKAHEDPSIAGFTQGQFYLPLIGEGRIFPKPWIRTVNGQLVTFEDSSEEEVDAIVFGTGFRINLPFLSPEIRSTIGTGEPSLRLYRHTFHPQLPGLAFLGLFHQSGPYFPPLELQARWIVYVWTGQCRAPAIEQMEREIASQVPSATAVRMNERCIGFARDAGVEPDPDRWPQLKRALLFGPLAAISFRLSGPDALPDAAERFAAEAAEFGAITSPELRAEEEQMLKALNRHQTAAI